MTKLRIDWALAGALLVGLIIRALYLLEISAQPDFCHPVVDAGYHDAWARALLTGQWQVPGAKEVARIPTHPYFRPPGHPYFLAGVYWMFGPLCFVPRLVQMALGLVSIVVGYQLAQLWAGRSVARVLALLMAMYWVFPYFEGELLDPVLLVLLVLLSLLCLARWVVAGKLAWAACAGVAMGACALVRPNILVFVPVAAGWMLWCGRGRASTLRALRSAAVMGACVLACVGVATVRNLRTSGDFVLVSANLGINLYIGNNAESDGTFVVVPDLGDFENDASYAAVVRGIRRKLRSEASYAEVSSYLTQLAVEYIVQHPGRTLELVGVKMVRTLAADEHGHNEVIHYDRAFSTILSRLPGHFGDVLGLAVLGMAVLELRRRGRLEGMPIEPRITALLAAFLVVYAASYLPFFVNGQYRVPLIPPLLAIGAVGVVGTYRLLSSRRFASAAMAVAFAVGALALSNAAAGGADSPTALAKWHYDRALALQRIGAVDEAVSEYELTIRTEPGATMAYGNLALLLTQQGRSVEAERLLREAIDVAPRRGDGYGRLAAHLLGQGRLQEAKPLLEQALSIDADLPTVHTNLGILLAREGDHPRALHHLQQALSLRPDSELARQQLALSLRAMGRTK